MIRFCLNGNWLEERDIDPNWTVLRYLRTNQKQLAAKEGCASGDCGACSILVGEHTDKGFQYQAINSCITLLGSLHGRYLVTVEALKDAQQMHPVQQAMVEKHGSQCGFCTPGIVSALTALHFNRLHESTALTDHDIHIALSGNLCRCTGYRSILNAAHAMFDYPAPSDAAIINQTAVMSFDPNADHLNASSYLEKDGRHLYIPKSESELQTLLTQYPDATLWAGGTDLGLEITQGFKQFERIISLHQVASLKTISQSPNDIRLGSMVTYSESEPILSQYFPAFANLIERIGSRQIRNLGTLGGNVANGSPIGDTPPVFFALNARLILASTSDEREITIDDFYHGYKQTDLKPGEYLKTIILPKLNSQQHLHIYKISKRKEDDISAVLMAGMIEHDGKTINHARIAYGGMAATPSYAKKTEQCLLAKPLTFANFESASQCIAQDYSPIDDVRASQFYRLTVAANLIKKMGLECMEAQ